MDCAVYTGIVAPSFARAKVPMRFGQTDSFTVYIFPRTAVTYPSSAFFRFVSLRVIS